MPLNIGNEVIDPKSYKIIDSVITTNMRQLEDKGFITIFEVESTEKSVTMPAVFGQHTESSDSTSTRRRRKKTSENKEDIKE